MADTPVRPSNGRHALGSAREAELEGIDSSQYDVFLTDKNLAEARKAYPDHDWFISFSVKDKHGKYANMPYTLTLIRPAAGVKLYAYYDGTAHLLEYIDAGSRGNQRRVKVSLEVGDPPVGAR